MRYGVATGARSLWLDRVRDGQAHGRMAALDAARRHAQALAASQARSGDAGGLPGGPENPLGARALYLYDANGKDTLYRIHGTNEPTDIGHDASSGCIRMRNIDVIDLYNRAKIGTKVIVM